MGIKTYEVINQDDSHYAWLVKCPACEAPHSFDKRWEFDGNHENPTFNPSMLVRGNNTVCHSYLRNGVWEYLADCTHTMKSKMVGAPDWESSYLHYNQLKTKEKDLPPSIKIPSTVNNRRQPCKQCNGTGSVKSVLDFSCIDIKEPCEKCNGRGTS